MIRLKSVFILMLINPCMLSGQETQWLRKNLGSEKEIYQFRLKEGLQIDQLKVQFPIRFEMEWMYVSDSHSGPPGQEEFAQLIEFEEKLQQELKLRHIGIWVGGFTSNTRMRWILYVKEEVAAYRLLTELEEGLPQEGELEVFEKEDFSWEEYRELKQLILEP